MSEIGVINIPCPNCGRITTFAPDIDDENAQLVGCWNCGEPFAFTFVWKPGLVSVFILQKVDPQIVREWLDSHPKPAESEAQS